MKKTISVLIGLIASLIFGFNLAISIGIMLVVYLFLIIYSEQEKTKDLKRKKEETIKKDGWSDF